MRALKSFLKPPTRLCVHERVEGKGKWEEADTNIISFRAAAGYEGMSGVNNCSLLRADVLKKKKK